VGSSRRLGGPRCSLVHKSEWKRNGDESDAYRAGRVGSVRFVFCGGGSYVCGAAVTEDGVQEVSGCVPVAPRNEERDAGGDGGDVRFDCGAGAALRDDLPRWIGSGGGCAVWRVDRSVCDWGMHDFVNLNIGWKLAVEQSVAYFVEWLVVGIVIGLIYRPAH
jgi:hypothetical protein